MRAYLSIFLAPVAIGLSVFSAAFETEHGQHARAALPSAPACMSSFCHPEKPSGALQMVLAHAGGAPRGPLFRARIPRTAPGGKGLQAILEHFTFYHVTKPAY